jgi:hypothetical protein
MQDRVFQPVSGPLYDAENNMKTAPQLRLRNEWEGRTQTRSKRNNSCRFQRNRCGFLPLITVWPQVRALPGPPIFACSASYGTAGHPASRRWISPIALMCWIRAGWFITLPRTNCWPTMISRNVIAQCDPAHRLVNDDHEQVLRLSRRFSVGGSAIRANRRVIGNAAVCYCHIRLSENDSD